MRYMYCKFGLSSLNISAFGLCFSFVSQGQAEEEKDDVHSDTDLKLEKQKVKVHTHTHTHLSKLIDKIYFKDLLSPDECGIEWFDSLKPLTNQVTKLLNKIK